jgi:GH18 family chitinase
VTNWSQYRPGKATFLPEKIDPFICTHVIIAYATFNREGFMLATDANDKGPNGFYQQTINLKKRNPSLKVLISVGGSDFNSKHFSNMVKSFSVRTNFIASSLSFLKDNEFDGLGIFFK